jgi:hypothetical protein
VRAVALRGAVDLIAAMGGSVVEGNAHKGLRNCVMRTTVP